MMLGYMLVGASIMLIGVLIGAALMMVKEKS
jgi:hypothetical protein